MKNSLLGYIRTIPTKFDLFEKYTDFRTFLHIYGIFHIKPNFFAYIWRIPLKSELLCINLNKVLKKKKQTYQDYYEEL